MKSLKITWLLPQKNAIYCSKTIQNEIISLIGHHIQKKILLDIHNGSSIFSVIADEARDCSNKEQMPLVIRYVNSRKVIQESFMAFIECEQGTTGEQMAILIQDSCNTLGLDFSMCRGQGYDGAGNMAGSVKGAAQRIRSIYPKAMYFHCAAHKLNLSIAQSCQLASVSNMMDAITCLANFFNYSPQRQKSFEVNVAKYPDSLKKNCYHCVEHDG